MNSIVCTLFENQYHYGVAALTNSLYLQGFRGDIYAGYKGTLPPWANKVENNTEIEWENCKSLTIERGLKVHFLPITTDFHLANYKPYFMQNLLVGPASKADAIVYFDPDIVIKCQWSFYETWIQSGVALVHEIISNDMPVTHPVRLGWKKLIEQNNLELKREIISYINSGFCGVLKDNYEFIDKWRMIMDVAIAEQNLDPSGFAHSINRSNLFFAKDQDALNIAAMVCDSPISEIGPEGMDFIHGGFTMSHAVGSSKPWKKNYILKALKGYTPSLADHRYWTNVNGPIICYSSKHIKLKRASIRIASFVGRFYRKY